MYGYSEIVDVNGNVVDSSTWQDLLNCPWKYIMDDALMCKFGNHTFILSEEDGICLNCPFEVEE